MLHQSTCSGEVHVNPDLEIVLAPDDTLLVIAPMEALLALETMNRSPVCAEHASAKPVGLDRAASLSERRAGGSVG